MSETDATDMIQAFRRIASNALLFMKNIRRVRIFELENNGIVHPGMFFYFLWSEGAVPILQFDASVKAADPNSAANWNNITTSFFSSEKSCLPKRNFQIHQEIGNGEECSRKARSLAAQGPSD